VKKNRKKKEGGLGLNRGIPGSRFNFKGSPPSHSALGGRKKEGFCLIRAHFERNGV